MRDSRQKAVGSRQSLIVRRQTAVAVVPPRGVACRKDGCSRWTLAMDLTLLPTLLTPSNGPRTTDDRPLTTDY
jgi:hypothetical protein